MSKRFKHPPVDFQDFLDTKEAEDSIPVTLGGKVFVIRTAILLSDDEFKALTATEDPVEVARITIKNYDEFVAAGGSAAAVMAIVQAESERRDALTEGENVGESVASSSS